MESKRLEKIPSKYRRKVEKRLSELSKSIQTQRKAKGYTQEGLAEKLAVSPMTIQFIEQGRRYPSVQMLIYICEFLEIEIF